MLSVPSNQSPRLVSFGTICRPQLDMALAERFSNSVATDSSTVYPTSAELDPATETTMTVAYLSLSCYWSLFLSACVLTPVPWEKEDIIYVAPARIISVERALPKPDRIARKVPVETKDFGGGRGSRGSVRQEIRKCVPSDKTKYWLWTNLRILRGAVQSK